MKAIAKMGVARLTIGIDTSSNHHASQEYVSRIGFAHGLRRTGRNRMAASSKYASEKVGVCENK
jgi:hypothetical protein